MPELTTRYGALSVPDAPQDLIGRFLLRSGEWAYDEVRFVAAAIRVSQPRICDIGAYLGTFGLGLAQQTRVGKLVFVEPNPTVLPSLRANALLAEGVDALVLDVAVGAEDYRGRPTIDPTNLGSMSFAVAKAEGRIEVAFDLPRISLAQLRREHGPFDLVKIDAEGLEAEILSSDMRGLRTEDCAYWLECNEDAAALELCSMLLHTGFRLHYFAFPSHSPDNFLKSSSPIFPWAFEAGLWASRGQPPELEPALAAHGCTLVPIVSPEDLRVALWRTPRFGMPEWEGASATVLAALAGRTLRGDDWDKFPDGTPPPLTPPAELRRSLTEVETALAAERGAHDAKLAELAEAHGRRLAEAETVLTMERSALAASRAELADAREATAGAERIRRAAELLLVDAQEQAWRSENRQRAAEARAVVTEATLRDTAERLRVAEIRTEVAEAALRNSTERQRVAEARAAEIEASTTWRASGVIRTSLGAHPGLRRALKAVLRPIGRARRWLHAVSTGTVAGERPAQR
jgi:FkbM family methyltransferase